MINTNKVNKEVDKFELDEETIRCLQISEEDIEKGRTRDAIEVMKELEEKYGFWECYI